MIAMAIRPVLAGLGLGVALASAPGPVQAVLLSESVRGGVGRGARALAGANLTFGSLLVALALGLSVATPSGLAVRTLKVLGGALLIWLAIDGLRSAVDGHTTSPDRRSLPPVARGVFAVLFNPGAWLFFAAVASPLFASAVRAGGRTTAVLAALALMFGTGLGDAGVVLVGGIGVRGAGERVQRWVRRCLAAVLASLGVWLLVTGVIS